MGMWLYDQEKVMLSISTIIANIDRDVKIRIICLWIWQTLTPLMEENAKMI